jgi:hypothetical protein
MLVAEVANKVDAGSQPKADERAIRSVHGSRATAADECKLTIWTKNECTTQHPSIMLKAALNGKTFGINLPSGAGHPV